MGLVVVVAILLGALYFAQEYLIFPGAKLPSDFTFRFGLEFEERLLDFEGQRIDSLLFHPANSKGLILYFHGNAGNLEGWGQVGQQLAEKTHMSVWIMDYPGYGKSEGRISSEGKLHRLAEAFFAAAEKLSGGGEHLIVYGRSVGTGLASRLASEHRVGALILESPFFSLSSVVADKMSWVPSFLLRYKFRSDLWLPKVQSPVLMIHGDNDEIIPVSQGRDLAALQPSTVFVTVAGGHHNDLPEYPAYWDAIDSFLRTL